MSEMIDNNYLIARMSQRTLNAMDWIEKNPILADGEIGIESDTNLIKIGDGTTSWINLPY